MKRIVCLIALTAVLLSFTGCAVQTEHNDNEISIATTVFPPYDFVRQITEHAENVTVVQLLRPGMESHTFDPTPADILAVQNCDLFIYTGGESDQWVETLLEAAPDAAERAVRMVDLVDAVGEDHIEGSTHRHEHEHEHEHESDREVLDSDHVEYDEHVWTDPHNAMIITESLCQTICGLDVLHAALYEENTAAYLAELKALDELLHETAEHAEYRTLVFGDRFPMRYLCDAYGLGYRAAFPGCAAESEPSAATMIYLIEKVKTEKTPAILTIEMSNQKIASAISDETGVPILQMHSCHNRTSDEAAADKSYLDLMYENAEVLKIALGTHEH